MKSGIWHQFGDRSQKLVIEQLEKGNGVGVIISPRDLSFKSACKYSEIYHDFGTDVVIDLQFYNSRFDNKNLQSYQINDFRKFVSGQIQVTDNQLSTFAGHLHTINRALKANAILSPALVYESGRYDLIELNARIFSYSKKVGDDLGIPTYSTIVIGHSAAFSEVTMAQLLSFVTSLDCDGWYFGCEFDKKERIPSNYNDIIIFGSTLLTLACTGKPVLHSFAGPLSLLSMGYGATGVALGHSQNLWQFIRGRWEIPIKQQGGGGDAPPRYFSTNLWGTIVYPDEFIPLSPTLRQRLLTPTPYSVHINLNLPAPWSRWEAGKHLVFAIGTTITKQSQIQSVVDRALFAINLLECATRLGNDIQTKDRKLKDNTFSYQDNWKKAMVDSIVKFKKDYEYLSLLV